MFDPYFTTKRTGSGLGLAIAKNIVEGLGGTIVLESTPERGTEIRIEVRSAEGIGTTMRIWLPLVPPEVSSASTPPLAPDLTSPAPATRTC